MVIILVSVKKTACKKMENNLLKAPLLWIEKEF
jgi:hypothetical protein